MGEAPTLLYVRERSGIMACPGAAGGTLDHVGYYQSLKENTLVTQHARPPASPRSTSQNTRQNAVLTRHRATWGRPTYGEYGAISGLLFLAKRSFSASASKF